MMKKVISFALIAALSFSPVFAQNVLFDTRKGDTKTIDGMDIGDSIPNPGRFNPLAVDSGTKTATATSGAATLNKNAGAITSESLSTAAAADYTLTLTNSDIAAADQVVASVQLGSSTTGEPAITSVTPAAGSVVIKVRNIAASAAFNGTIIVSFVRFAN
jgi:hypothetical protein